MDNEFIEPIIDDLRKLIGYGATVHRLPTLWALRDALDVAAELPPKDAGKLMRRRLLARIRALNGTYELFGREINALQLKLALQVLLRYDYANAKDNGAEARRTAAMRHLGVNFGIQTWRREFGQERELLALLAGHLGGEAVAA